MAITLRLAVKYPPVGSFSLGNFSSSDLKGQIKRREKLGFDSTLLDLRIVVAVVVVALHSLFLHAPTEGISPVPFLCIGIPEMGCE